LQERREHARASQGDGEKKRGGRLSFTFRLGAGPSDHVPSGGRSAFPSRPRGRGESTPICNKETVFSCWGRCLRLFFGVILPPVPGAIFFFPLRSRRFPLYLREPIAFLFLLCFESLPPSATPPGPGIEAEASLFSSRERFLLNLRKRMSGLSGVQGFAFGNSPRRGKSSRRFFGLALSPPRGRSAHTLLFFLPSPLKKDDFRLFSPFFFPPSSLTRKEIVFVILFVFFPWKDSRPSPSLFFSPFPPLTENMRFYLLPFFVFSLSSFFLPL